MVDKLLLDEFSKNIGDKVDKIKNMSLEELINFYRQAHNQIREAQDRISILSSQQHLVLTEIRLRKEW